MQRKFNSDICGDSRSCRLHNERSDNRLAIKSSGVSYEVISIDGESEATADFVIQLGQEIPLVQNRKSNALPKPWKGMGEK